MNYLEILRSKQHNPNYILREFDENLAKVMDNGFDMTDRTGVGCRYLPGIVTNIDISERVPVPTLRATKWKAMLAEYLWFLTGEDEIGFLEREFNSKVWNFWKKPEWAKSKGLTEDSIGYGYGPNLIHFGADIPTTDIKELIENHQYMQEFSYDDTMSKEEAWQEWRGRFNAARKEIVGDLGFNQVDHVVNLLKTNPNSRRILWSFFRPDKQGAENTVLDPCHLIYQFIPEPDNRLSCVVYIRSNDLFVGALSTNLQGAAFYANMLAQQCGYKPSKLIVVSAHAHIYHNHFEFVEEYLQREEVNSPILKLNQKDSIYEYTLDDFELIDYNPLQKMKVPIAV